MTYADDHVIIYVIDLLHKFHNSPVPYPIMHHFVTEMCTCVYISVAKWCIMGHLFDALWCIVRHFFDALWCIVRHLFDALVQFYLLYLHAAFGWHNQEAWNAVSHVCGWLSIIHHFRSILHQSALNMEILIDDIRGWYSDNTLKLNDSKKWNDGNQLKISPICTSGPH